MTEVIYTDLGGYGYLQEIYSPLTGEEKELYDKHFKGEVDVVTSVEAYALPYHMSVILGSNDSLYTPARYYFSPRKKVSKACIWVYCTPDGAFKCYYLDKQITPNKDMLGVIYNARAEMIANLGNDEFVDYTWE